MDFDAIMQQALSGPSEADKQRALAQALAAAGFSILGARTGGGWRGALNAVGQGGLLGQGVYNNEMANASAAPMQQLAKASALMDFQGKKQAMDDAEAARQIAMKFQMPQSAPGPQQAPYGPGVSSLFGMPQPAPVATPPQKPIGNYERLNAIADAMEAKGLVQQAEKYRAMAKEYAPQYDGTETVMRGGKPVLLQKYKNQAPTEMDGYQPKPDYRQIDTGGGVDLYDPLSQTYGGRFTKTQSPDAKASNAVAWANFGLAKQKEAREAAGQVKPTWDSASGQFVYAPSENAPQGRAVQPQGFQGKNANSTIASQKALAAVDEAQRVIDDATGSYLGAGMDIGAQAFGHATEGAKAIAKLKVLESNIMMNQPRMEGPQSDKDVMLYRQAAGQLGDPTVPIDLKKAALDQIRAIHEKYASINGSPQRGATGGWSITPVK